VKILYVEDDPLDADLTRRELLKTSPPFDLDTVTTMQEALARLEHPGYDLVLTDMRLLDGDGLTLLTHIRQRLLPLAVVLITGSGDAELAVAALKAGADDYVVKRLDYLRSLPQTLLAAQQRFWAEATRHTRPLRVLYAEDNPMDVDLTRRHLARHAPHISLHTVKTAEQVMEALQPHNKERYDILLLDYRLPSSSGLELLQALRQLPGPSAPIVLVTGQGNEEVALQALKLGASDYVVKTGDYLFRLPIALENADNSARLRREQAALRTSEERYRRISELTSDFTYAFGFTAQGKLVAEWKAGAVGRVTGFDWDALLNQGGWTSRIYAQDHLLVQQHLEHVRQGKADVAEFRVVSLSGALRWIRNYVQPVWNDERTSVVRFYGAAQDITSQKQAEEKIWKLNQDLERRAKELDALNRAGRAITASLKLEAVLQMVMQEVCTLLSAEGASILLRDPATNDLVFAASSGLNVEELSGVRVPLTAGIAGWVVRERRSVIVNDVQHDQRFYRAVDAVTALTTRALVAVPLMFKGAVWGVMEAINKAGAEFTPRDCEMLEALASSAAIAIENAQLYSSLQETNAQLQVALQAKDEMVQNVSHELRTPLGLIYGYIELLLGGDMGTLEERQKRAVQIMITQADRLRFMVDRLLAMQTFEVNRLVRVRLELGAWLRQVLVPWEARAARAKIQLHLQETGEPFWVMADSNYLSQVVENLIDNALKFSPPQSQVCLELRRTGDEAEIIVTDRGVGIPPDKLEKVFERFYQVDGSATRKYGGMGIGLALCREIVNAHGGRIWVESHGAGQGSQFHVALRIAPLHHAS